MASSPRLPGKIDGETMETVTDFIFFSSKITADGDCSHEIKSCLLLGRKAMINLDRILKSRDITLPTKVHLVKAMVQLIFLWITYTQDNTSKLIKYFLSIYTHDSHYARPWGHRKE